MLSEPLTWLTRLDKSILPPRIVVSSLDYCSGYYSPPRKDEECVDGRFISLDRGLIVVSDIASPEAASVANTIAHEWRHHWQIFRLGLPTRYWPFLNDLPYWEAIYQYFTGRPTEMDALRFANRRAPCPETLEWAAVVSEPKTWQETPPWAS